MRTDIEMSVEIVGPGGGSLHWDAGTRTLIHSDSVSYALVATVDPAINVDATFVQWIMEAWADPAGIGSLDEERLAQAIDEAGSVTWDDDPGTMRPKRPAELARDVAPIYARLGAET